MIRIAMQRFNVSRFYHRKNVKKNKQIKNIFRKVVFRQIDFGVSNLLIRFIKYIYIITMEKLGQSNFIFKEIQDEAKIQNMAQLMQQQLQYSNHVENTMKKYQVQGMNYESTQKFLESKLIVVQAAKSKNKQPQIDVLEVIQLLPGKKQRQMAQEKRYDVTQKEDIIYPYEQSEEIQDQPQSSIRKLYKAMKRQENQIEQSKNQQRLHENEKQDQYYQQQQQSQEEQNEDYYKKTQVRSKSLRQLILFKIPQTKLIKCLVKIANDSFFSLQTVFHFYLVQQKQLLMTAKKKKYRFYSRYDIFGKENGHVQKLAIARSNFLRTQYKLSLLRKKNQDKQKSTAFSSDLIKMTKVQQQSVQIFVEEEKCYLSYQSNFLGLAQQKVQIIKPKKMIQKTDRFSDIKATYENCQFQRVEKFGNKLAQINTQGKLVIDFKDNTLIQSSKNMLVENQFGVACLLFGKKRNDLFILNIMNPFNFLQGFFVAMCNLDRKLLAS